MTTTILSPATLTAFPFFGGVEPYEDVLPNPVRTIIVDDDELPKFPDFWTTATDVMGFNLSWRLAPNETILGITSFDLIPTGPGAVTDPDPTQRIVGTASIAGNICSQRFGNWQDLPTIDYEVELIVSTSLGNSPAFYGTFTVNRPVN